MEAASDSGIGVRVRPLEHDWTLKGALTRPQRRIRGAARTATGAGTLSGMPSIGPLELAIVLVIVLLIFGPKRLPGLGRQLGSGMREFKDSITGRGDDGEVDEAPAEKPAVTAASDDTATTTPAGEQPATVATEPRPQDAPRAEG